MDIEKLKYEAQSKALDKRFNFDFDPCPYCEGEVIDGLSIEWGN